ncbi:Exocyst complex component SEC3A [Vitis vinifera]|uniref:Exocyst complex component SEC3A n=1 Tax=Vitis vinifera TaxID=29760 RepID=A0A438K1R3_VITVI|nr:Exocyst complex component SEC3A [Vitis vinifera]
MGKIEGVGALRKVGNGRRVSFWRDRWCGDSPLCESFPSLFALSAEKEARVADVWDPLAEGGWSPCFSRALNDWEVEIFLEHLHGKRVLGDVEDMVVWTETKSGRFSAKSLYLALEVDCPVLFPSSCIWNRWVQPKISFFAWEAAWGKALTLDLVQKRGWSLANRCFMCLEKEETINHLLLHCSKIRALWELLFTLFGVSWVLPSLVRETLLSWHGSFVGNKRKKMIAAELAIVVKEKRAELEKLKTTFVRRASEFLRNYFASLVDFMISDKSYFSQRGQLKRPDHADLRYKCRTYARLLQHLKSLDKNCLGPLRKAYCSSLNLLLRREAREFANELRASTKASRNPTVWLEASTGSGQNMNNTDTSNVSDAYAKMLTIFIPLLVDESSFFAHFMCFEVPALVPPGGHANGNKTGSNDDDANDDDLGILDIDENDNKTGKNSAELGALNESLQDLLDGIQEI